MARVALKQADELTGEARKAYEALEAAGKVTNMKLVMNESDHTIADLMTDGCNMGVKSLSRYLNQYKDADHASKEACRKLISIEEQLCKNMKEYL